MLAGEITRPIGARTTESDKKRLFKHSGEPHLFLPPFGVDQEWKLLARPLDIPFIRMLPPGTLATLRQSLRFSRSVIDKLLWPLN